MVSKASAWRRFFLLLPLSILVGCPGKPPPKLAVPRPPAAQAGAPDQVDWRVSKSGLGFRLSDADPAPPPRPKLAPSKPLTPEDTARLLARMPAFKAPAEEKKFALRDKSRPAPRPGETISTPFPPQVTPPRPPPSATPGAAPAVVRWAPEGDVEIAPSLSLTFSEPMVAVTSHSRARGGPEPGTSDPAAARQVALDRHADAAFRADGRALPEGH